MKVKYHGMGWHDKLPSILTIEEATEDVGGVFEDWFTITPALITALQEGKVWYIRLGEYSAYITLHDVPDKEVTV